MALSDDDPDRLCRCVELAHEAFREGDEPFPVSTVAPGIVVEGPANGYADSMKSLYEATFR